MSDERFEAFKAYLESDGEIEFDMWARDPKDYPYATERYPGLVVFSAGGMLPFQAEGLVDGYPWYYRDEWGKASLRVGELNGERPYADYETLWSASCSVAEWQESAHFEETLVKLVGLLEKSPFCYTFVGNKLLFANNPDKPWEFTVSEELEERAGWGHSPEEAFDDLFVPSDYLSQNGCSEDKQFEMALARNFNRTPVSMDKRVYPEVTPDFLKKNPR